MIMKQAQFNNWGIVQWRTLTWAEFKKFEAFTNTKGPMAVANDIYRACIRKGPTIHEATAGLVEFVVKDVYSNSAFTGSFESLDNKLNAKREELNNNYLLSARAVIAGIFKYTFEEIDSWDEDTFLIRLAQAEFIAGKPLLFGNPIEERPLESKQINQKPQRPKRELSPAQQLVIDRVNGK